MAFEVIKLTYLLTYLLQPLWRNWPAIKSNRIRWKTQNKGFYAVQGHRGRYQLKTVHDFLLVINSNWHPISYRFGVIAAYCSNFGNFAFLSHPLGGLGTLRVHLGLIGKRAVDFPLVLIELFFARSYNWGATSDYWFKIGDFAPTRAGWPKISGRRDCPPTNHSSYQKTRLNYLSHGIKIWTDFSSVLSHNARVWQTDRQTDRYLIARPRLHSMQRGKKHSNEKVRV